MLRTCSRIIAAMVALSTMAQAADATLTLACQGTAQTGQTDAKPEPISMGIIVNFTARTVQGLVMDFPVKIDAWDEVTVTFGGYSNTQVTERSIHGSIDRVTGDVEATSMMMNLKTGNLVSNVVYALKCRPAQRMF